MALHAQHTRQSDRHFSHTETTKAPSSQVWGVWVDVPHWKTWDSGLKDASIKESFALGAKGTIISLEDRKSSFIITEYEEGKSYVMKTKLPLGSLYVKRYLTVEGQVTTFTHEVWFKGVTGGLFAKAFGREFRKMLPGVLKNIKDIVEE